MSTVTSFVDRTRATKTFRRDKQPGVWAVSSWRGGVIDNHLQRAGSRNHSRRLAIASATPHVVEPRASARARVVNNPAIHSQPPPRLRAPARFGRVGQEVLQRAQQKGAEAAPLRVGPAQRASFHQVDKEILRKVLRAGPAVAPPPDEGVDRVAVGAVKAHQGRPGFRAAFGGGGNQPPLGREEVGAPASRRVQRRVHGAHG
jgi:hypothetical protein